MEQGEIVIRDANKQQQNVASLSRDTASANGSISPIFDKEKEQKRLQTAQAVGEITGQMVSIVNTMGDIKGLEEAKKGAAPLKDNATEKERAKWLAGLRESDAYQKAMSDYGVGSKNQMVVQAVSGVLQGLVNGNISQAVAGAANPLVAQVIKAQTTDAGGNTNVVANAMAHAVWGAVAAQMSGGNAAAGAAGAFSGELATRFIAEVFYHASTPEEIARLSQADKEQLSLLGTIAAGAAGAVAGNSSAAATTGALAGKNAVENNALGCTPLTCKVGLDLNGGGMGGGAGGSSAGTAAGVGLGAVIAGIFGSDDSEKENQPNVGKNLSDAEKVEMGGSGSGTGTPPPENEPEDPNDKKPSNIKMADDKYLKKNGIDAHKLKEEFLGDGKNSRYDFYINKESGEVWIFRKGGKGDGIPTGEFIK